MNETATPMLYRNLGSTGWQHNYQNQDLYTFERQFIYEFAKTSLYEWQKQLGMLSPYAEVYYLPTDKSAQEQNTNKNETSIKGKDQEEKKTTVQTNDKENEAKHNNDKTNEDNKSVNTKKKKSTQENINVIKEDWVQVKYNAKTKEVHEAIQRDYINNIKNSYAALKEDDEKEDEEDDIKKVSVAKKAAEEYRIMYNVNDITIDEMEQVINDFKKNDVIVNAPEETKNEEREGYCTEEDPMIEYEYNVKKEDETEKERMKSESMVFDNDNDSVYDLDDSDNSIDLSEEKSSSSDIMEEEHENEVVKTMKEEYYEEKLNSKEKEEEERLQSNEERDHKMRQLLYQNDLLLFRLEQAEINEEKLREELYLQTNTKKNDTTQDVRIQKQLKDKEEE